MRNSEQKSVSTQNIFDSVSNWKSKKSAWEHAKKYRKSVKKHRNKWQEW